MKKLIFMCISFLFVFSVLFSSVSCKKRGTEEENGTDAVAEINFSEKSAKINLGESFNLNIEVKNAKASFNYEIEDSSIVSVQDGKVKALKVGSTNVKIKVVCDDKNKTTKEFTLAVEVVDNRTFTVTYVANIEDLLFHKDPSVVKPGEKLVLTDPQVFAAYEFVGYSLTNSLDGDLITELNDLESDITVYALYKPVTYTIEYKSNVASFSKNSDSVEYNKNFTLGEAPEIAGYTFKGWSLSLEYSEVTVLENVKENKTVYAIYDANTVTISYLSNVEGFSKESDTVEYGKNFKLPKAPAIEGYTFRGWSESLDFKAVLTLTNVTADKTMYAIYKLKSYTVSYDLDGGSYKGETSVEHGKTLTLGTPTKEGYKFLGWSLEKDSTEYVTEIVVTANVKVYANWKFLKVYPEGVYPIEYDLDGGSWKVQHATPEETGTEFMEDFKTASGHGVTMDEFDTAYMESSWFAAMMTNKTYLNKWMWLLDAIYVVANGSSDLKADTADFNNSSVKGFYMTNLNGYFNGTQHTESNFGTVSANYSDPDVSILITNASPAKSEDVGPETYTKGTGVDSFPSPVRAEYIFKGWIDQNGNPVTSISATQEGEVDLKAVWEHETIAENIEFTNIPADGFKLYDKLQLTWVVTPADAVNKKVQFYVIDKEIVDVSEDGFVKAKSVGTGKVRVRLESNPNFEKIVEFTVWNGNYFDVSYETNSYVKVDEKIQLNAAYIDKEGNRLPVSWLSLTESIATVDDKGMVTGLNEGMATIRAKYTDDLYFDFKVTVLGTDISKELQYVLDNHHSNASTTYNLGIGDGNPEYYYDVVGSVNNLLFDSLKIDRRYYDQLPLNTKNYGLMSSVEFITVHYTGNMHKGADADNNCDYFNNLEYKASIHFVTGRTNLSDLTGQDSGYNPDAYYAFAGLNEKYAGWHATNKDPAVWDDTGLTVQAGDPATPVISISKNLKYTINGRESNISIPTPPAGFTIDGNVLTVNGKQYSVFNQYGPRAKVVDGKYYLARTHWGTQSSPSRICTMGGNLNSIGIESCVDIGSDLMHTWHVTAQLVASLLVTYNLGFDRVVGHHFFSGKDCPQPLLELDMKLWYEFMDMVKAEYELLTTYKDVTITSKAVDSEGILRDNGLLVQDADAHCVTYEVTVKVGDKTEKVTLATCVESYFMCDCVRTTESLQNMGYEII